MTEHLIKFRFDSSEVVSNLRALGNELKKLSQESIVAASPQFKIPRAVEAQGGEAVAKYTAQAAAQYSRAIASGSPNYRPGDKIDSKITTRVTEALRAQLDPVLTRMGKTAAEAFDKAFNPAKMAAFGAAQRASAKTNDAFLYPDGAPAQQLSRRKRIATEQERLDLEALATARRRQQRESLKRPISAEDRVLGRLMPKATTRTRAQIVNSFTDPEEAAEAEAIAKAAQQRFRERYRAFKRGDTNFEAVASANDKGTDALFVAERAKLIATDVKILDALVTARKNVLDLTNIEVLALTERRLRDNASIDIEADRITAEKRLNEAINRQVLLRVDDEDIKIRGQNVVGEERLARQIQLEAAQNRTKEDASAAARLRVVEQRFEAAVTKEALAAQTVADINEKIGNTLEQKRQAEQVALGIAQQRNANDARIVGETQALVNRQNELARTTTLGATTPEDLALRGSNNAVESRQGLRVQIAELQAKTQEDIILQAQKNVLDRALNDAVKQEVLASTTAAEIRARAAITSESRRQAEQEALEVTKLITQQDLERAAEQAVITARQKDLVEKQVLAATTQADLDLRGGNSAERNRQKLRQGLAEAKATTPADIDLAVEEKLAKQRIAKDIELNALKGRTARDLAVDAEISAVRRRTNLELQTAEYRELRNNKAFQEARALRIIEERKYIEEQRKTNARVAREQGYGGTSLLARLLGRATVGGLDSGESKFAGGIAPTLGQFFGRGFAGVARYALPSAIGFGAISGIGSTIKEAEELDRIFAQIESQFDASFGAGAQPKFEAFKKEILQIAKDTGVAGEELANIGFQLQGAFGNGITIGGKTGTDLVDDQLRAAAEISKVTGLSSSEITDSLTAASLAFDVSFRDIGDVTVQLQDRFGVLAKEIVPFLGDIAPVAKEAGFSLEEFATIAAVTQQKSGKSGSALAEAYGRVIPAISGARQKLIDLSASNNLGADFTRTVAAGSIKEVFFAIADTFDDLNDTSKEFVINLLGGRREAQSILAAFDESGNLAKQIEETGKATGTLADRFDRISKTVSESLSRLKEQFRQLGVQVYEGGLGDALKTLIDLLSGITAILSTLFGAFSKINDATGGWAAKITTLAGAYLLLSKSMKAVAVSSAFQSIGGLLAGRGAAGAAGAAAGNPALAAYLGAGPVAAGATGAGSGFLSRLGVLGAAGGIGSGAAGTGLFGSGLFAGGATAANIIPPIALAAIAAFVVKGVADGVARGITEQKEQFKQLATEELQKTISGESPYAGGFKSDLSQAFKEGLSIIGGSGKDASQSKRYADQRYLANDELNRRLFEQFGSQPLSFEARRDGAAQQADLGPADALRDALSDPSVLAALGKEIEAAANDPRTGTTYKKNTTTRSGAKTKVQGTYEKLLGTDLYNKIFKSSAEERQKVLAQLVEDAANSDTKAFGALSLLSAISPEFKAAIEKFKAAQAKNNEVSQLRGGAAQNIVDFDTLRAEYESGDINIAEYLNGIANKLTAQRIAIEAIEAAGRSASAERKVLAELEKTDKQTRSNALREQSDFIQELFEIGSGKGDGADLQNVNRLKALLRNDGFKDPKERLKAAMDILNILQQFDKDTEIPPEVRSELANAYLNPSSSEDWAEFMNAYKLAFGSNVDAFTKDLVISVLLGLKTAAEVKALIAAKTTSLLSDEDLAAAQAAFPGVDFKGSAEEQKKKALDAFDKVIESVKIPTVAKTSKKGAEETADKIREAKQDYLRALIEGDPVKLAQLALQQAEEDFAAAGDDEAKQYKALAAKIRASRQLEAALYDVAVSKGEVISAIAEFRGDNLEVANLALDKAIQDRDRINELFRTGGAGEADVNRAEVALIQAKAKARDTQLSSQKDDYQFLYDMGQITKSQFIAYLETLKQIPDLTTQQIRDLDREIKQLQQELSQDLQFNLPTKFKLPTLYEVRRINQAGSSQAGYVDNRNVNIVLNVNDGTGQQQMMQILTDVVGGGARIVGNKRY